MPRKYSRPIQIVEFTQMYKNSFLFCGHKKNQKRKEVAWRSLRGIRPDPRYQATIETDYILPNLYDYELFLAFASYTTNRCTSGTQFAEVLKTFPKLELHHLELQRATDWQVAPDVATFAARDRVFEGLKRLHKAQITLPVKEEFRTFNLINAPKRIEQSVFEIEVSESYLEFLRPDDVCKSAPSFNGFPFNVGYCQGVKGRSKELGITLYHFIRHSIDYSNGSFSVWEGDLLRNLGLTQLRTEAKKVFYKVTLPSALKILNETHKKYSISWRDEFDAVSQKTQDVHAYANDIIFRQGKWKDKRLIFENSFIQEKIKKEKPQIFQ